MTAGSMEGSHRSVFITGGLGDIGRATALRLAQDGHTVTVSGLAELAEGLETLDALAGDAAAVRSRLAYVRADVEDPGSLEHAIVSMPRLDIAIANAAIVDSAPFLEITPDSWQKQLDTNAGGASGADVIDIILDLWPRMRNTWLACASRKHRPLDEVDHSRVQVPCLPGERGLALEEERNEEALCRT